MKVSNNEILLVDNNTTSTATSNKYDSIEDGDDKELLTNQAQREATSITATTVPFSKKEISAYVLTPIFTFVTWGFISGLIFFLFISPKYPWFFFKLR